VLPEGSGDEAISKCSGVLGRSAEKRAAFPPKGTNEGPFFKKNCP